MKAAQIERYGAPSVLRINEVDRPAPGKGEVLVQVDASSVNGHDVIVRSGGLKMVSGRKFPLGTGLDFAGVVAATGPGPVGYRAGDRVWGSRRIRAFSANPDTALLKDLAGYVASGAPRPVVSSVFPLADIAAAH